MVMRCLWITFDPQQTQRGCNQSCKNMNSMFCQSPDSICGVFSMKLFAVGMADCNRFCGDDSPDTDEEQIMQEAESLIKCEIKAMAERMKEELNQHLVNSVRHMVLNDAAKCRFYDRECIKVPEWHHWHPNTDRFPILRTNFHVDFSWL